MYYSIPACYSIFDKKLPSGTVQPANIPLLCSKITMTHSRFKALSSSCIMAMHIMGYRNRKMQTGHIFFHHTSVKQWSWM